MTRRTRTIGALCAVVLLGLAPAASAETLPLWWSFSASFRTDCALADPAGSDCAVRYTRDATRPFRGAGTVQSARDLLGDQVLQLNAGPVWFRGTTGLGFSGRALVGTTGPVRAWGATWAATGTASGGAPGQMGGPLRITHDGARWSVTGYLRCLPVSCRIPQP